MIGETIEKYRIMRKIGEGGMATVYHGRHMSLNRDVAIKLMHPGLASTERNKQRFSREAKAIERLDHPNILKILDYSGLEAEHCYIVTELIEGITLRELLNQKQKIPSEIIALLAIELTEALSYAHERGLIHRDLKLENVMLRNDGIVKLMDFGIARFTDEDQLTMTGTLVGSPAYMSPEQAKEEPLDARSDLFSLGTLLYHLSTGELPYQGSNPSVILKNIIDNNRSDPLSLRPDLSLVLSDIINQLLQSDRLERPQTAQEVREELVKTLHEAKLIEPSVLLNNSAENSADIKDPVDINSVEDLKTLELELFPRESTETAFVPLSLCSPVWSVGCWLISPEQYTKSLNSHLSTVLMDTGLSLLKQGQNLEAQRIFNRLLCITENEEQIEQIYELLQSQQLREPDEKERNALENIWLMLGLTFALVALITYALWPNAQQSPMRTSTLEPPSTTDVVDLSSSGTSVMVGQKPAVNSSAIELNAESLPTPTGPIQPTEPPRVISAVKAQIEKQSKSPKLSTVKPTTKAKQPKEPTPDKSGTLTVSILNAWANVWIDGEKIGRTGKLGKISLSAGKHNLKVENPFSIDHTQEIEILPNQNNHIEIKNLKRKSAYAVFSSSKLDGSCIVYLDSQKIGSLGAFDFKLEITEPNIPHDIMIECPKNLETSENPDLGKTSPAVLKYELPRLDPGKPHPVQIKMP